MVLKKLAHMGVGEQELTRNFCTLRLPIAQLVKNPPAMQEIPVRFLGQEDPLEKG